MALLGSGVLAVAADSPPRERGEPSLLIPLLANPPSIDGRIDEWEGALEVGISKREQVASESAAWPWEGPGDASAEILLGIDQRNLYIGGTIKDDHIVPNQSIWWRGDAIELFIDTDLEGDRDVDSYNEDDYQIFLMPMSPSRRWGVAVRDGRLAPSDGGFVGVQVRGREREGGYTFEASIPLANFPEFPRTGKPIGFALAVNDNDWPREGEIDAAYMTIDGAGALFEHTTRFLAAGLPELSTPGQGAETGVVFTTLMKGVALAALLTVFVVLALFARRLHDLLVKNLPGWRRLGLIALGVIALSVLVVPQVVESWFESRSRHRLESGVGLLEDALGRLMAAGLFDRWPGLSDPQVLLDLLSGIGVEPRRRYDYTPLEIPGMTSTERVTVAEMPFRPVSVTLEPNQVTAFELPARLEPRELLIAVQTHFEVWRRTAPRERKEIPGALRVTLRSLGGGTRSFDFALDDGERRDLGPDHDTEWRRLGVMHPAGHSDVLVVPVEKFFSGGGLIRVSLEPRVAGVGIELQGMTSVDREGAQPLLLGAMTQAGIPTLLSFRPQDLARTGTVVTGAAAWSCRLQGSFDTLWLVYQVQDSAQVLRQLEGEEVARFTLTFADGSEPRRLSLQVGRNVRVPGQEYDDGSMESEIALRYRDGRVNGFLESLAIRDLGRRPLESLQVECLQKRCPVRVAAVTGGAAMPAGALRDDAPVTAGRDGRRLVLRPELAEILAPLRETLQFDVAVDGIVKLSTLGAEGRQRHIGVPLPPLGSLHDDRPVLRPYGDREYWVRDVDMDVSGHRITLRVHSEVIGRQAVERARRGIAIVSSALVLPFGLLYLIDWLRRRDKIRMKLTALLAVTSVVPIVLLSLLVLRVVGEERQRVAKARASELIEAAQTRIDNLIKAAQDAARGIVDDRQLVSLVDRLSEQPPTDERALERELRRMAEGVALGIPVAVRLTIEQEDGQRTLRASPDPSLDPGPDFAGRGLIYDWGQVEFRATAERLDRVPLMRVTVGGVVNEDVLSGVDLRLDEAMALYSLDRQLGDRHLPGGILLAGTAVGAAGGLREGTGQVLDAVRTLSGIQFRSAPSGMLEGLNALVDRQGQPVAVIGAVVSAAPFRLDLIVASIDVDWLLVLFGAVMLAAALFLGGLVTDDITVPIERLEQAARAVSGGGATPAPVSPAGDDEIGRLTDAYNFMTRELERRMGEQERLRALQMELAGSLDLADRIRVAVRFLARELRPQGLHLLLYDRERDRLVESSLADGSEKLSIMRGDSLLFDVLGGFDVLKVEGAQVDSRRRKLASEIPSLFGGDETIHLVPLGEAEKEVGVVIARMTPGENPADCVSRDHLANMCSLIAASIENARLYQLAIEDPITGLAVHNYLMRRLSAELDRSDAECRGITLLVIKVEEFEAIERELGTDGSADILRQMARSLERVSRPMDVLAREGTDRFLVLLPEGGRERAERIVEQVFHELPEICHAGGRRSRIGLVHASAAFPDDGRSREYLVGALARRLQARSLAPQPEPEAFSPRLQLIERQFPDLVFNAPASREILDQVARVAASRATVMILGETGVGKEVLARVIHRVSDRGDGAFVAVSCSALPETLLESELFGHEKGAFTGADRQKIGRFELADRGTLFLDEVGEMSPATQVKLLRVLQERCIQRLGGRGEIEVDVRILTATNRNLEEMVRRGTFREDLYYRLKVITITIPPLRERKEEIPDLVELFIAQHNREHERQITGIEPAALDRLYLHSWPGNVRELRNVMHRAALLCQGDRIEAGAIEPERPAVKVTTAPQGAIRGDEELELNDRQRQLLALLRDKGTVTNREYFETVGVSRRTALRDVTDLMDRGLIVRRGHRRGSQYQLARSYLGPGGTLAP